MEDFRCEMQYSRTWKTSGVNAIKKNPVTRTLKGNKKGFELARVRVIGVDSKIQFAMSKILITDFSAVQCGTVQI